MICNKKPLAGSVRSGRKRILPQHGDSDPRAKADGPVSYFTLIYQNRKYAFGPVLPSNNVLVCLLKTIQSYKQILLSLNEMLPFALSCTIFDRNQNGHVCTF